MKKLALVVVLLLAATGSTLAQGAASAQDYGLPELHVIKTVTLSPSYSCRSEEEFQKGYENTALFLSAYSTRRNSPEVLFNGACHSNDTLQALGGGFDMSLIVDLGPDLELEKLTAQDVFHTYYRLSLPPSKDSRHSPTALRQDVEVVAGHTYAVFLNKREIRGMFVLTVTEHVPNERVKLRYAVKEYEIADVRAMSPGFDWGQDSFALDPKPVIEKARGSKEN
ncbi:MAG TPA: hypothetical protein VGC87_26100 [Pyrinomonadaceae bacterium]|jgi:hypothetical protein